MSGVVGLTVDMAVSGAVNRATLPKKGLVAEAVCEAANMALVGPVKEAMKDVYEAVYRAVNEVISGKDRWLEKTDCRDWVDRYARARGRGCGRG